MSRDRGNLTSARRSWRQRTARAVARAQGRCTVCQKVDKTGLIAGKCTSCFVDAKPAPPGSEYGPTEEEKDEKTA